MKKIIFMASLAAAAFCAVAGERPISRTGENDSLIAAGEKVYAGNIAAVATNGLAYAVNTASIGGTLTVCGVFMDSAGAGEKVAVKRGGFVLDNAGNVTKAQIGQTVYSVSSNAWTVTKTSGTKAVGKVANVFDDGRVAVVVGK